MSKTFEIFIFTASLSKYAEPLIKTMDPGHIVKRKLYREHCTYVSNTYIKDLSKLNRNMRSLIIVDNAPISYMLQPENALPISTWISNKNDSELEKLSSILELLSKFYDVRPYIKQIVKHDRIIYKSAETFLKDEISLLESKIKQDSNKPIPQTTPQIRIKTPKATGRIVFRFNEANNTPVITKGVFRFKEDAEKKKEIRHIIQSCTPTHNSQELDPNRISEEKPSHCFANLLINKKEMPPISNMVCKEKLFQFSMNTRRWLNFYDNMKLEQCTVRNSIRPTTQGKNILIHHKSEAIIATQRPPTVKYTSGNNVALINSMRSGKPYSGN